MNFIFKLFMLPSLIIFYLGRKLWEDGLGKSFPIEGLGLFFYGAPLSLLLWMYGIYFLVQHVQLHFV